MIIVLPIFLASLKDLEVGCLYSGELDLIAPIVKLPEGNPCCNSLVTWSELFCQQVYVL
jgi:hypothetical protein